MKTKLAVPLVLGIAFLITTTQAQADVLYGGNGSGSVINPGALITVNQTNGAGTLIGDPITPGGLAGLTFDLGALYGSTVAGSGSASNLVVIDPNTGALVSTIGPITVVGGGPISIGDLAANPMTGVLYGIRSNTDLGGGGGFLYTINTATGVATFVGDTNAGAGGGLAFTPDGRLFQTAYDSHLTNLSLNQLNPTNASRISTVFLSAYYDGLGIRSDGVFFASGAGGADDGIYTIDPITGASTLIGHTGVGAPSDLTFLVPEPTSITLLIVAGVGALTLRLRRRKN